MNVPLGQLHPLVPTPFTDRQTTIEHNREQATVNRAINRGLPLIIPAVGFQPVLAARGLEYDPKRFNYPHSIIHPHTNRD
jgi:hypothetical protein